MHRENSSLQRDQRVKNGQHTLLKSLDTPTNPNGSDAPFSFAGLKVSNWHDLDAISVSMFQCSYSSVMFSLLVHYTATTYSSMLYKAEKSCKK